LLLELRLGLGLRLWLLGLLRLLRLLLLLLLMACHPVVRVSVSNARMCWLLSNLRSKPRRKRLWISREHCAWKTSEWRTGSQSRLANLSCLSR
jgi:hypothetical protein